MSVVYVKGGLNPIQRIIIREGRPGADGSGGVASVNARTGAVTLTSADVALGNVNNTSDVNKPVSTAQQTALDTKAATTYVDTADALRMLKSANLGDVASASTSRTNLGLGSLATLSTITSSEITNDTIVNADINSAAAIVYSKLSLGTSIKNTDIIGTNGISGQVLTNAGASGNPTWQTPSAGGVTTVDGLSGAVVLMPWQIFIDPRFPYTQQGFGGLFQANGDTMGYIWTASPTSGTQNDFLTYQVALSAGTWVADFIYYGYSNNGIGTLQVDGVSTGQTVNFFSGSLSGTNKRISSGSFTVAASGIKLFKILMATTGNVGYNALIQGFCLRRTS